MLSKRTEGTNSTGVTGGTGQLEGREESVGTGKPGDTQKSDGAGETTGTEKVEDTGMHAGKVTPKGTGKTGGTKKIGGTEKTTNSGAVLLPSRCTDEDHDSFPSPKPGNVPPDNVPPAHRKYAALAAASRPGDQLAKRYEIMCAVYGNSLRSWASGQLQKPNADSRGGAVPVRGTTGAAASGVARRRPRSLARTGVSRSDSETRKVQTNPQLEFQNAPPMESKEDALAAMNEVRSRLKQILASAPPQLVAVAAAAREVVGLDCKQQRVKTGGELVVKPVSVPEQQQEKNRGLGQGSQPENLQTGSDKIERETVADNGADTQHCAKAESKAGPGTGGAVQRAAVPTPMPLSASPRKAARPAGQASRFLFPAPHCRSPLMPGVLQLSIGAVVWVLSPFRCLGQITAVGKLYHDCASTCASCMHTLHARCACARLTK